MLSDGQRHYAMRITTELSLLFLLDPDCRRGCIGVDDCIYSERHQRIRQMMLNLMSTPEQKVYIAGDSSTDTFYCYVNTGRKKIGNQRTFRPENYYNRFIYDDKMPEYLSSKNWYYNRALLWPEH